MLMMRMKVKKDESEKWRAVKKRMGNYLKIKKIKNCNLFTFNPKMIQKS